MMAEAPELTALTGVQKAALIVMQLSQQNAAQIMRQLSESEAEEITGEIVRMTNLPPEVLEATIAEFHARTTASPAPRGGMEAAQELLEASYGAERAASVIERLSGGPMADPFDFLVNADASQISTVLDGELPETIALVLVHLSPDVGAAVLASLDPSISTDVAQCIASMGTATPEAIGILSESLRHRARAMVVPHAATEVVGGVQPLVDIINRADVATERAILESLDARDPALAEEVRSRLLTFADIVTLGDRDVQQVLRGIDATVLALALKGAAEPIVTKIRSNMSDRNRLLVDEETESLGRVRRTQQEEARAEVVRAIRTLESEGVITVKRDEEAEDYVE